MHSMQVKTGQLQDANSQLEVMRARSRELRLRVSDLQAREQQLREVRYQTPAGPERERVDRQWLAVRHDVTAATIELEGLTERIGELRSERDHARALTLQPPPAAERPPVEVPGLVNAGIGIVILFVSPLLIVLVYRLWRRGAARDPLGLEASPRLQRMELAIESIAMEVERIAEGQRFTTRILAERQLDSTSRVQAKPREEPNPITPR
jgi:hypothetical protein